MNGQLFQRAGFVLALIVIWICLAGHAAAQSTGTARAWGHNSSGQLGNGTNADSNAPVLVSELSNAVSVSAGAAYSMALRSDGTVWTWGYNSSGQLGNGTNVNSNTPVQVSGLTGVIAIAAGAGHGLALKSDGTVYAWGYNAYGQLGNGSNINRKTPVQVTGLSGVVAIAAGYGHSLALKSDGTLQAWGYNYSGQLGNGTNTSSSTPTTVTAVSGIAAIAAGQYHSLALKSDGTLWAWGYNHSGQLGNGTNTSSATPVAVPGFSAVAIAAGTSHTLAKRGDGTVWAWGYNYYGQLGNGTTADSNTPVAVPWLSGVATIAAGQDYSLALNTDGTLWAWGDNYYGQLGTGSSQNMSGAPVQVLSMQGVLRIAAGGSHTLALSNPVVSVSPSAIDFGTVDSIWTSSSRSVTITNNGPDPLVIGSVSLTGSNPGDFSVSGPAVPITLLFVSSSATFNILFLPSANGTRSATLVFGDNGFQSPHTVSLTGTGAPPQPADLIVSQTVVQSGRRLSYTINVRNNGPGWAGNVVLRGTSPAQTQFVGTSGASCSSPDYLGFFNCNLGFILRPGVQTAVGLVVDVTATQETQISNTASVSSSTTDPSTRNNSSTLVISWTPAK